MLQIYLSVDWLTSYENILERKLDGKYFFVEGWSIKITVFMEIIAEENNDGICFSF